MTEEIKPDVPAVEVEAVVEAAVAQVDPVAEQATAQGWVPKEEWVKQGKSADEWRPAKEFVERGELYKSIHTTKRELKQTQAALTALQRHHQYVFEKARIQALDELKKERRMALREGDLETVEVLDDRIEDTTKQFEEEKARLVESQAAVQVGPPPEFEEWKSQNTWYETDNELKEYADAIGIIYINKNPKAPPVEVLKHIDGKMRKQYPDKFGVRRAAPNAVAAVDRTAQKAKGSFTMADVPEEMRPVIRNFCESTGMSEADYIKQLKKSGAL